MDAAGAKMDAKMNAAGAKMDAKMNEAGMKMDAMGDAAAKSARDQTKENMKAAMKK